MGTYYLGFSYYYICDSGMWVSLVVCDFGMKLKPSFVELKSGSVCILDVPW